MTSTHREVYTNIEITKRKVMPIKEPEMDIGEDINRARIVALAVKEACSILSSEQSQKDEKYNSFITTKTIINIIFSFILVITL
ncbi:unnamed protein product [Rhizophagus irregularis]|uniref:Uncharacterized protein n=1 Tax=Rhizophagus irregularis TaxID=588596 RepID=A0A916EBG7_9GLOM|nr:unnamed protein product [Rhizophagus irregularis]CAB5140185.1 unnamed protein product [Rhizophagus irregularis]CAB5374478.1 unnamed protein product [Rhizophagus irregularis]